MLEAALHPLMLYQPIWVIGFTIAIGELLLPHTHSLNCTPTVTQYSSSHSATG